MSNWISVDERLPDEENERRYSLLVLVTNGQTVWTSNWWNTLEEWSEDEQDITHWQPLPEPPEK